MIWCKNYACDNDEKLRYDVSSYFKVDKDTPVIFNVMTKKYAPTDTTFASSIAIQEAREEIYVKGEWYLEFDVTDNNSISSIVFADSDNYEESIDDSCINKVSISYIFEKLI